jgi:polyisoprenoid-binding protein YceI
MTTFPATRRVRSPLRTGALLVLVACLAASAGARAEPGALLVDSDLTRAWFAVAYLGIATAQGRFGRTSGTITVDAQQKVERIDLAIDAASVDMGWDLRDAFVRSEVMFDTQRFPQLRFRSTQVFYEGARLVGVDGDLTLRGVTRPVRLDVARVDCAIRPDVGRETCGATVTGRISRRAFGMDFAYPLIGDEVELQFEVTALRVGDATAGNAAQDRSLPRPAVRP